MLAARTGLVWSYPLWTGSCSPVLERGTKPRGWCGEWGTPGPYRPTCGWCSLVCSPVGLCNDSTDDGGPYCYSHAGGEMICEGMALMTASQQCQEVIARHFRPPVQVLVKLFP